MAHLMWSTFMSFACSTFMWQMAKYKIAENNNDNYQNREFVDCAPFEPTLTLIKIESNTTKIRYSFTSAEVHEMRWSLNVNILYWIMFIEWSQHESSKQEYEWRMTSDRCIEKLPLKYVFICFSHSNRHRNNYLLNNSLPGTDNN